jgi:hypothetical protein
MLNKIHIAVAVTLVALAAVSIADTASAGSWFSWRAVPLYMIPL